jgi:hypothetical protein
MKEKKDQREKKETMVKIRGFQKWTARDESRANHKPRTNKKARKKSNQKLTYQKRRWEKSFWRENLV